MRLIEPSEKQFQDAVVDFARINGWDRIFHAPRGGTGGRVHANYPESSGFPDLVMVRGHRLVMIELKARKGRLSEKQKGWLDALRVVPAVEVHVFRPDDWLDIQSLLGRAVL